MSEAIQIILIVCGTIIFLSIFTLLFMKSVISKEFKQDNKSNIGIKRDTERFGYCKSPTYPGPLRPGCGIGHNPSPAGEKPGFPGRKSTDTLEFSQEDE